MLKDLLLDFLVLTTAPELLLRFIFNPQSLEDGNVSKYAQWVYKKIGE
jgi:hypothetical protein